jgi:hypothetical protein
MSTNTDDIVIHSLKARWFDLVEKEDYPKTPDITKQLDNLTEAIRKMQAEASAQCS